MKKFFTLIFVIATSTTLSHAEFIFEGTSDQVIMTKPAASTGLEAVYIVRDAGGVSLSYSGATSINWSRFGSNGAAYAETIGSSNTIALDNTDAGYIAEIDGRPHYIWIVNYSNHNFTATAFDVDFDASDCQRTALSFTGTANRINYYTINGRPEVLDREISVSYTTLEYDDETDYYKSIEQTQSFPFILSTINVEAPLSDTRFTLCGDKFLKTWNSPVIIETQQMKAYAVAAETTAEQTERNVDNEQKVSGVNLGGSAPCDISFSAAITDAASFYEWQLSKNADFDPIDDRYPQTELEYTFREQGTTYVRFFAANSSGECEYTGPTYEVSVGESSLLCPNAFSPQSTPGVNDEWKVSYKSLISFDCHIFNRWGTEIYSFTDPSLGWDGKYNGKYVPAGTYYYVIKAVGADGREYKLSGDINIINAKNINNSGTYE